MSYNPSAFGASTGSSLMGLGVADAPATTNATTAGYAQQAVDAYQRAVAKVGGYLFPQILPLQLAVQGITSAQDAVKQLEAMELEAVTTANLFIDHHNRGMLTSGDYARYDLYRHRVYDTQVEFHRAIRSTLVTSFGKTVSDQAMTRIPWPSWLPALSPSTPGNQPFIVGYTNGTHGLGAAQFVVIGAVILLVLAALGLALYFSDDIINSLGSVYLTRAQSRAVQDLLKQRDQAYQACIDRGTIATDCAAAVDRAYPTTGLDAFMHRSASTKSWVWYLGLFTAIGVVGFVGYKIWGAKQRSSGTAGLGRATRLRGLNDPVRSRYMLEVE